MIKEMTPTRRAIVVGGGSLLLARPSYGRANSIATDPALQGIIDGMVRDHGFQGVVMLGLAGKPSFQQAVGAADILRNTPVRTGTQFGIASISKRLTTVAVMRLIERGQAALDTPITTYLPWYRADTGARVTLRRLLSNSSGVPNGFGAALNADKSFVPPEMSAEEAVRRFASGDLAFEPGARFDYAITNWFVVLAIVEAVTRMRYADAMRRLVIEPLKLADTTLTPLHAAAKSYRTVSPVVEWPDSRRGYRAASGGYYSTAADLLRFAHQTYDTGFLSGASRSALTTIEVASDSYSLGGRVRQVPIRGTSVAAAWETGNTAGYRSVLGHRLDGKGTVVLLNNTAMSQRIMDEFADALLGVA